MRVPAWGGWWHSEASPLRVLVWAGWWHRLQPLGLLLAMVALLAGFSLIAGDAGNERGDPLVKRMNRFAETYRQFAERHNRGVFDAALAKKLSQEWREVEASGEWPRSAATSERERGCDSR
jgi:hypothetical protein